MLAHSLFVRSRSPAGSWNGPPPREATGISWGDASRCLAPMTGVVVLQGGGLAALQLDALV